MPAKKAIPTKVIGSVEALRASLNFSFVESGTGLES
jgi:hypothetical protein